MKKVTILGEELNIHFCMASQIGYESITGKPFDLDSLKSATDRLALCCAIIVDCNPGTAITYERLVHEMSGSETADLLTAVTESLNEWLAIPSVVRQAEAREPQPDVNDEAPKN